MITKIPYEALGHHDFGWLNARYHFSFSEYYNPDRMEFGTLRVINDDRIAPGKGFARHPHKNMEIITYVRQGAITHQDSLGNEGRTQAGDIQVMSAGSGIEHAEFNAENEETRLYQIWILPDQQNVKPRWESRAFPKAYLTKGPLPLLVSSHKNASPEILSIYQDAAIYGGRLQKGTSLVHPIRHQVYLLASQGTFFINDVAMKQGDGAEIKDQQDFTITADSDCELLIIDVPDKA